MKRSDTLTWSHVRTGILIIVGLLCASAGVLIMGEKTKYFTPKGKISVIMTDVSGLKVGAPVWLAGVDIGVVTDLGFKNPKASNEIAISIEVDEDSLHKIGSDSVISIKTRGLMGEKYVDITPSSRYHEQPEKVVTGAVLPKLDDVIQKAGTSFDRLNGIIAKVESGEGSFGKFVKDDKLYNNLNRLSLELNSLASNINRGDGTLGKLIKSSEPYDRTVSILERVDTTLKEIQSADGTMGRLVRDRTLYDRLATLAEKSVQAAEDVRELNRKLTSRESSIGMLLTDRGFYDKSMEIMGKLESSSTSIDSTLGKLSRGEGSAGKLLNDREAYDHLNRVLGDMDALLKDIKENPNRYVKFSLF